MIDEQIGKKREKSYGCIKLLPPPSPPHHENSSPSLSEAGFRDVGVLMHCCVRYTFARTFLVGGGMKAFVLSSWAAKESYSSTDDRRRHGGITQPTGREGGPARTPTTSSFGWGGKKPPSAARRPLMRGQFHRLLT